MTTNEINLDLSGMDLIQLQEQIVAEIRAGKSLLGQGGLLTPLIKSALEATLEGEMNHTLMRAVPIRIVVMANQLRPLDTVLAVLS